jgi:hypothetical protein
LAGGPSNRSGSPRGPSCDRGVEFARRVGVDRLAARFDTAKETSITQESPAGVNLSRPESLPR